MIDQSHNIEPKMEAMLQSVLNCQEAYAKALLVDQSALRAAQVAGDVLGAHRVLNQAFRTDVRELINNWRKANQLPDDPFEAVRGYSNKVASERGLADAGGGYPSESHG